MRFLVSGPVSWIRCVPSGFAQLWITPRGWYRRLNSGNSFGSGKSGFSGSSSAFR